MAPRPVNPASRGTDLHAGKFKGNNNFLYLPNTIPLSGIGMGFQFSLVANAMLGNRFNTKACNASIARRSWSRLMAR